MSEQPDPTPAWRSYADQVIQALLADRRKGLLVAMSPDEVIAPDPREAPDGGPPAPAGDPDTDAGPSVCDPGPAAYPAPRLAARELSLALRLVAARQTG